VTQRPQLVKSDNATNSNLHHWEAVNSFSIKKPSWLWGGAGPVVVVLFWVFFCSVITNYPEV